MYPCMEHARVHFKEVCYGNVVWGVFHQNFNMNFKRVFLSLFEYYTPKIVHIKNRKIGVLNRLIQFLIIVYIICFVILYKKGYQEFSSVEGTSIPKLKGVVSPNFTEKDFDPRIRNISHLYLRTWDVLDYVHPALLSNGFFVATNVVITPDQEIGVCPEDPTAPGAVCTTDEQCPKGHSLPKGNGIMTGRCVKGPYETDPRVCEVSAWCPVERDFDPLLGGRALLTGTKHSTVLIKNYVAFPLFKVSRRNIPDKGIHRLHCNYETNKNCPIFFLKTLVPDDYDTIALRGGAIAIDIDWKCNFDYSPTDCFPTYQFRMLALKHDIAPRIDFRYARYFSTTKRTQYKFYGIKFQIFPIGKAGKFNVVPLLLNIGSGIGLLAITTVVCDIVALHIVKRRKYYYSKKFQDVENPENLQSSITERSEESGRNRSPSP